MLLSFEFHGALRPLGLEMRAVAIADEATRLERDSNRRRQARIGMTGVGPFELSILTTHRSLGGDRAPCATVRGGTGSEPPFRLAQRNACSIG